MNNGLYIGLMSGTSIDSIDAALVELNEQGVRLIDMINTPWPNGLNKQLKRLSIADSVSIDHLGELDRQVAYAFADAANALIRKNHLTSRKIQAIGSHGQTIRHRPHGHPAFSWQIGDPNTLAEQCGITVVADFRRRDIAAGGQGAPLVPAFHQTLFSSRTTPCAVLNIGGIANLTLLEPRGDCLGFDTGPGNTLLDGLMQARLGMPYDEGGSTAMRGKVLPDLLAHALEDPYFHAPAPKSTGPEYFSPLWLERQLKETRKQDASTEDLAATLTELSAQSIVAALRSTTNRIRELLVCGGGVHNPVLISRLRKLLPETQVNSTQVAGIDPDWIEAMAFAWLAWRTLNHQPGNLPTVTGATGSRILGGIYPA